jgi:hypothetical protein
VLRRRAGDWGQSSPDSRFPQCSACDSSRASVCQCVLDVALYTWQQLLIFSIQFKVNYVVGRSYLSFICNADIILTWCFDEKYLTIHKLINNNCIKRISF